MSYEVARTQRSTSREPPTSASWDRRSSISCSAPRTRSVTASGSSRPDRSPESRMKRLGCLALVAVSVAIGRAADSPLTFVGAIELPRVEGRIDHLAFDASAGRLYVAALGNNTVEVLDTKALRHLASLTGFAEPQG